MWESFCGCGTIVRRILWAGEQTVNFRLQGCSMSTYFNQSVLFSRCQGLDWEVYFRFQIVSFQGLPFPFFVFTLPAAVSKRQTASNSLGYHRRCPAKFSRHRFFERRKPVSQLLILWVQELRSSTSLRPEFHCKKNTPFQTETTRSTLEDGRPAFVENLKAASANQEVESCCFFAPPKICCSEY